MVNIVNKVNNSMTIEQERELKKEFLIKKIRKNAMSQDFRSHALSILVKIYVHKPEVDALGASRYTGLSPRTTRHIYNRLEKAEQQYVKEVKEKGYKQLEKELKN